MEAEGAVGGVQGEEDPNYGLVDTPLVVQPGSVLIGEGFGPFTTLCQQLNADPQQYHKDCYLLIQHDGCDIKEPRGNVINYRLATRYSWVYHPADPDDESENKPAFCLPPLYTQSALHGGRGPPIGIIQPHLLAIGRVAINASQHWNGCKPAVVLIKVIFYRSKDTPLNFKRTWGKLPRQVLEWLDGPLSYANVNIPPRNPNTNRAALGNIRKGAQKYLPVSRFQTSDLFYNSVTLLCSKHFPGFPQTVIPDMVFGNYAMIIAIKPTKARGPEVQENYLFKVVYSRINPIMAPVLVFIKEIDLTFECELDVDKLHTSSGCMAPWVSRRAHIRAYTQISQDHVPQNDGAAVSQAVLKALGDLPASLDPHPRWLLAENVTARADYVPHDGQALRNLEARYPYARISPLNPWVFDSLHTPGVAELAHMLGGGH